MIRRVLTIGGLASVGLMLLIQFVPYGRAHNNPHVTQAARFTDLGGEQLMRQSCGDCHTNLTSWRWYSNIAPASWLVTNDVDGGRSNLNFSEWNKPQPELREVLEIIDGGEMPPLQYTLIHPGAKLSDSEKRLLRAALTTLYASDSPPIKRGD